MTIDPTEFGLSERNLNELAQCFDQVSALDHVVVFGSRAKGNFSTRSDIDLCLFGDQLSTKDLNRVYHLIDDSYIPYQTDLVVYHRLDHPELKDHIDHVGKVIWQRKQT